MGGGFEHKPSPDYATDGRFSARTNITNTLYVLLYTYTECLYAFVYTTFRYRVKHTHALRHRRRTSVEYVIINQ